MNSRINIRLISLFLSCITISSLVLSSCSNDDASKQNETDLQTDPVTEAELSDLERRDLIDDGLPELKFDGRDFRIYAATEDYAKCFFIDTADGDVVNDAIARAISTNEERFNVDISVVYSSGDGNPDITHNQAILTSIKSDDHFFEIAENHDGLSGTASVEGNFVNLLKLDYLDFDKPWWASSAIESLTYMDQLYLGSSMMSYRGLNATRVLFFNKGLLKDYGIDEPYETVFAGDWTIDALASITKDTYEDLDSDGKKSEGDLYGYIANYPIYTYLESYGIPTVIKGEDELTTGVNCPETVSMVEKLYSLIFESKGGASYDEGQNAKMFSNDQALFIYGSISAAVSTIRYSDVLYGIIPTPKLDENQENYLAAYTDRFFLVPQTTGPDDYGFIGLMIEAMSAEGYKKIYPAFYEVALKTKFTSDDESVRTLDLINECRVLDFAYVYCNYINQLIDGLLNPKNNPSSNFASKYKAQEKQINSTLKQVYEAFADMRDASV